MIEAALVWRAIDERLPVGFRSDLDAKAVLQIRLVTLARPEGPETTLGYSYDLVGGGR
jgi:hypothetical protein